MPYLKLIIFQKSLKDQDSQSMKHMREIKKKNEIKKLQKKEQLEKMLQIKTKQIIQDQIRKMSWMMYFDFYIQLQVY